MGLFRKSSELRQSSPGPRTITTSTGTGTFPAPDPEDDDEWPDSNPDPSNYKIIKLEERFGYWIALVQYPGCTTFNGKKLLLLRRKPLENNLLDPHLLGPPHSVMARFEPTEQGWDLARICCLMLGGQPKKSRVVVKSGKK